jgi:queuine tRNA-ribosyltransferase
MLMTQHNQWFYQRLMQGLRDAIGARRLEAFAREFLGRYRAPAKAGAQTGEAV